jgi:hypothetical protein
MQLNLFQWEAIETGEGCQNLSRLEFAEAKRHFAQALVISPDHQGARRGLIPCRRRRRWFCSGLG